MGGEKRLAALARKVRAELPGWTVRSATIAAGDHLKRELDASGFEPFVVPIFMTDGWFTNTCLPKCMKEYTWAYKVLISKHLRSITLPML